jgi:hypothetical protein
VPPLPNVPKVVKVALVWTDGVNDDIVSRFFVRYSGVAPSDTNLHDFGDSIEGFYESDLQGLVNDSVTLIRVECVDLSTTSSAAADFTASAAGTRAGTAVMINDAVVISYVLGRRYRGGHPRGYFPFGVAADRVNLQQWSTDFATEVDTAWTAFFVALEAAGWAGAGTLDHVSISYYQGFTVVTDPITGRARNVPTLRGAAVIDAVSSHVVRTHLGTQRRRAQY